VTRINKASLETFSAFGNASIALCQVHELARRAQPHAPVDDLVIEIRAAHVRLREVFADGLDEAVCVLAHHVMELASRMAEMRNQDQEPSGS
jgi:hypothetical protein